MPATLRHFAINADNVQRAKGFYEKVFGWTFTPWGPPDFYQVWNAGTSAIGALQHRRDLVDGRRTNAFETSFGVDDIRAALKAVEANGGRVLMQPYLIEGVGEIGYFEDSEGNICGVAQYLPGVWK
jgi:predicted enzyme related to lactoylglutathione lyase